MVRASGKAMVRQGEVVVKFADGQSEDLILRPGECSKPELVEQVCSDLAPTLALDP